MKTKKEKTINTEIQTKLDNNTLALVPDCDGVLAASRDGHIYNVYTGREIAHTGTGWSGYDKVSTEYKGKRY